MASGPDRFEFRPEGKLGMHTAENMQALRKEAFLPPYLHPKKVFIVYDVDRLPPYASNSLLKIFEEPPAGIHFILTTTFREKTLPTILSRAQCFWVAGKPTEKAPSPTLESFLKEGRYRDFRPFAAGIKAIADEISVYEDPIEYQEKAEEIWEALEARHPDKTPFLEEARFKLSRSTSMTSILESLFIKLGYL